MPPSGFSKKAIHGLLEFIKASYKASLKEYTGENEAAFLQKTVAHIEKIVTETAQNFPLAINKTGIKGLVTFVTTCYLDLYHEIKKGTDAHGRPVFDGKAMEKEINQIGNYLAEFTI